MLFVKAVRESAMFLGIGSQGCLVVQSVVVRESTWSGALVLAGCGRLGSRKRTRVSMIRSMLRSMLDASFDAHPLFGAGSDELVDQSMRSGNGELGRTTRTGPMALVAPAKNVELASNSAEGSRVPGRDGLTFYDRSSLATGTLVEHNIYAFTRADTIAMWGSGAMVPDVRSALDDGSSSLSAAGCRLWVSSERNGTRHILVATRGT